MGREAATDETDPTDTPALKPAERVEIAAREFGGIAIDESRVLARLLEKVMSELPHEQGHEVWAVHALCAHASDNFTMRLIRQLVGRALGWSDILLEPTTDTATSLRNTCDTCTDSMMISSNRSMDPIQGSAMAPQHTDASGDEQRMFSWLQALLGLCHDNPHRSCFMRSVQSLAPTLTRMVLQRMTSSQHAVSMDGALQVLQLFTSARRLESCESDGENGSILAHLCPQLQQKRRASSRCASPSLDSIEEFLQARKRRCLAAPDKGNHAYASVEPWTAVGTVLNSNTLEIHCRPERGASALPSADVEKCGQLWLAAGYDAPTEDDADAGDTDRKQSEEIAGPSDAPLEESMETGSEAVAKDVQAAGTHGETEFRQYAASLFSGLKPFDFVKIA